MSVHLRLLAVAAVSALLLGSVAVGTSGVQIPASGASMAMSAARGIPSSSGCPDLPFTPAIHLSARAETAFADLDPATTLTNFGTQGGAWETVSTPSTPTYREACPVGPAVPCWSFDGSDLVKAPSLTPDRFVHDGTGMTCVLVYELTATASTVTLLDSATATTTSVGITLALSSADSASSLVARGVGGLPTFSQASSTYLVESRTNLTVVTHGTARTPDYEIYENATEIASGSYANAPVTGDATYRLAIGARSIGSVFITGYLFEFVCAASTVSDSEWAEVQAHYSCEYGGDFPL